MIGSTKLPVGFESNPYHSPLYARTEVVGAFIWRNDFDGLAGQVPQAVYGSLVCFAEHDLEPGGYFLDRIEVGLYGESRHRMTLAHTIRSRTEARLWFDRLSMMPMSPDRNLGPYPRYLLLIEFGIEVPIRPG